MTRNVLSSRGGDRRWWMRTGTPFVRLCTKGSARKNDILGRPQTRLELWDCLNDFYDGSTGVKITGPSHTGLLVVTLSTWMTADVVGAKILQKMWEGSCWEGVWLLVGLLTTASVWNVPGKYGPHGELFFFLIEREPLAVTRAVDFRHRVAAETLKASALIGLHVIAERSLLV